MAVRNKITDDMTQRADVIAQNSDSGKEGKLVDLIWSLQSAKSRKRKKP